MSDSPVDAPAKRGTVYLVGAGPGDPGLVTRRALALVRSADVLYVDRLVAPELVAEARADAKIIDVGKTAGNHAMPQEEINLRLVETARAKLSVVRLKGGDPYLFGRGGEEAIECRSSGVPFEVVPAVTSAFAASADAGIPVTHRDLSRHVTVVTASAGRDGKGDPDYSWLAKSDGTIVLLMGLRRVGHVAAQLMEHGMARDTPVALVSRGTTSGQRTLTGTLDNIAERLVIDVLPSPAIIVVGAVVDLREQLDWFEQRPLFGRRIAVMRSRAQSSSVVAKLTALGADVVEAPMLRIERLPVDELDAMLDRLDELSTIVFTSVNAVTPFFERMAAREMDARALGGITIAVVGTATADACIKHNVRPDVLPAIGARTSVGLLDTLGERLALFGTGVGVVRAETGDDRLLDGLEQLGSKVQLARVYRTVREEASDQMVDDVLGCDLLTLTSESTVKNLLSIVPEGSVLPPAVSIGPTTSAAAAWANIRVLEEATEPSIDLVVDGVVNQVSLLPER